MTLDLFNWEDTDFKAINEGIRQLVFETVSGSRKIKGFIFTLVIGFDLEEDWNYITKLQRQFEDNEWKFHIVELEAP